jgi:hypothetical protein
MAAEHDEKEAGLTDEMRDRIDGRGDRRFNAYYFSFDPTGNEDIDRILAAVALAGKMFHHTEGWTEDDIGWGYDLIDLIQAAANTAALSGAQEATDG